MKRVIDQANNQRWVGIILLFTLLTIVMTYPVILNLDGALAGPPVDNIEYMYEVWWLKYALFESNDSPLRNPRIFFPFGYPMLAARHNSIANTLLTVPVSLLANEVVAYNSLTLLSFVLSGLGTYLLASYLTKSRVAGLIAGVVFAFCPYRVFHWSMGHLPQLQTQWLPFLFLYVERTLRKPKPQGAFMSGLFYALTMLSSLYYAQMTLVVMIIYVLVRVRPWREWLTSRRVWISILTFAGTVLAIAGPVLYAMLYPHASNELVAAPVQSTWISASIPDFFVPNFFQPLWGKYLLPYYIRNSHENFVSLGIVPILLMLVALWRNRSRSTSIYGLVFASSLVLALGPTLQFCGRTVYLAVPSWIERAFTAVMTFVAKRLALNPTTFYWRLWAKDAIYMPLPTMLLYLFLPFFNLANYPSRFGVFTVLAVAILAGTGADRLPMLLRRTSKPSAKLWLAVLIVGMVLFEFAAVPPPFGISRVEAQPVDRWLAMQEGDFAVMKYPISRAFRGMEHYGMTVHGKKIVYGYGAFLPRAFSDNMGILSGFPDAQCIALLKRWEVRYVLVYSTSYGEAWQQVSSSIDANRNLRYVTAIQEEPVWTGDRLLRYLPEYESWFVTDEVYIYEIVE